MTWVKLISPEKMAVECTRRLNFFDKAPSDNGDYINKDGQVISKEIYEMAGEFIEVEDLKTEYPTAVGRLKYFIRHAIIEKEATKEEYPELFL